MKPIRWFPAVFFFTTSSLLLAGCYTHLATSGQGYYTYHPRPVYSDTMRGNAALEKPLVTYDTTMHGDTMFIDEHRVEPAAQADGIAPNETGNTIINNYYGSGSYWDNYWGPSWGISVGFGWPYYHTWYSPWWPYYYTSNYYCDWWQPYGYFGYYPPYYDCYSPFYAGYYYPGYYGYGYYGGHHGFGDYDHHYGFYDNVRPGRVGGENRAGATTGRASAPGIAIPGGTTPVQSMAVRQPNLAQANAADVLRTAENRNAPVHVISPDASAALAPSSTAPAIRANGSGTVANAGNPSLANTRAANVGSANAMANTAPHPIVVRRMDGQTITTSSRAGHQMVVVRRAANYGSSNNGYRSNGYQGSGYRSGGYRGYAPSSRSNTPSQGYSAPQGRSYSPPARSYSPPEHSYSPPEHNDPPSERSAPAPPGDEGRANGGGESSGRAGGGGGRAR